MKGRGPADPSMARVLKGVGRAGALLLLAALAHGGDRIEKRDHGKRTGKQSVAVSGHAISCEASPDLPFVRSVLIHGARYGEGINPRMSFQVAICDEKFGVLAKVPASYTLFSHNIFTWVEVPLPEPVRVPRTFKVVVDFAATDTRGVYVGYGDVAKSRSSYFRLGERERSFEKGKEWMIRVRTSAAATPLRSPPRDLREALLAARVLPLEAGDLAASLARVAEAAGIAVVLDGASGAAPAIPAGSAAASLDGISEGCGVSWDVRWGVVYVATRERLEKIPAAMPEAAEGPGPTSHDAVALRIELARRRVDLDCRGIPLEDAVAQVSGWLEFPVRWDPRVDRRQRVTVVAESLHGWDALSLLLLPRGCGYRIRQRTIEIAPLAE